MARPRDTHSEAANSERHEAPRHQGTGAAVIDCMQGSEEQGGTADIGRGSSENRKTFSGSSGKRTFSSAPFLCFFLGTNLIYFFVPL